ncbi:hypothetical protein, partial [Paenibacillus xylanexedens]|uniref:hypothetical protein n=1 Tax=Paenibacillus xylanexedens TaxID=528191 RepID=UPI001C92C491
GTCRERNSIERGMYSDVKGEREIGVDGEGVVSLYDMGEVMRVGVKGVGRRRYIVDNGVIDVVSGTEDVVVVSV